MNRQRTNSRYTVADLPESGRWVVVDEASGKWVLETTDADRAERFAATLNKARMSESTTYLSPAERVEAREFMLRQGWVDDDES